MEMSIERPAQATNSSCKLQDTRQPILSDRKCTIWSENYKKVAVFCKNVIWAREAILKDFLALESAYES